MLRHDSHRTMNLFLLELSGNPNLKWILVAVAGATILYTVIRPAMRKNKDPLSKPLSIAGLAQQRNVERQMQNLLVELSEMARQLTAQLDTRSQKLEMLLHEADQKIASLKQVTTIPAIGSDSRMSSTEKAAWTISEEPVAIDPRHQEVYTLSDQGQAAPEIARQLDRPRGEIDLILALRPR